MNVDNEKTVETSANMSTSEENSATVVKKFTNKARFHKKECRFCSRQITELSYRTVEKLIRFTSERGKILPSRMTGNCAKHQRFLARQIKIARILALLPFVRE